VKDKWFFGTLHICDDEPENTHEKRWIRTSSTSRIARMCGWCGKREGPLMLVGDDGLNSETISCEGKCWREYAYEKGGPLQGQEPQDRPPENIKWKWA